MGIGTSVRKALSARQGCLCFYCGRIMTFDPHPFLLCTADHVAPRSEGGTDAMSNLVAACTQCNNARGTINSALFKRYVRRYGPVHQSRMATSNHARRRAIGHMIANGLSEAVANDILRVRLTQAYAGLAQR